MALFNNSGYSIETLTIWLLIIFSTLTWSLVIIKSIQFSRLKRHDRYFLHAFWQAKALEDIHLHHPRHAGAAANVAHAGFTSLDVDSTTQHGLAQSIDFQDRFERALRHQIQRESQRLEAGLALMASIGSISPFIGLFGTVWGIMEALQNISLSGSASLETVAGPVGSALLATGIGIAVAVPAVLGYNYFLRRVKNAIARWDDFAHDFYNVVQKNGFSLAPVACTTAHS